MSEATALDPVAAAVAAATKAAQEHLAAQANSLTVAAPQGGAVAPVMPGKPLGYDELAAGSITVDQWIGVKEFGLLFGQDKSLVTEPVQVEIDLKAVAYQRSIKFGNPATYLKTYDGVTCATGGSWVSAVERAQRADPKARDYPSADIPMKLLHNVTSGKKVVGEEGQIVGNSLSTTNWSNWKSFMDACKARGLDGQAVKATLGYQKRTNNAGNVWGVITFTLADN